MPYRYLSDRWKQFAISLERAVFRFDPAPGTGKNNWKFRNFYRMANCLPERKLYGDPDHRNYGRGKRYPSNLPNAWDDYPKARSHNKRDWKKIKKKKQWMKRGANMITLGPIDNSIANKGAASEKKKHNYDISETKAKGEDYTRPGKDASQTDDDDLRSVSVEEDYEVPESRKNPEKDYGQPGIRVHQDSFADVGQPPVEDILPPEDDTPVAVDDGGKHGSKNKYRLGGGEGKIGPKSG